MGITFLIIAICIVMVIYVFAVNRVDNIESKERFKRMQGDIDSLLFKNERLLNNNQNLHFQITAKSGSLNIELEKEKQKNEQLIKELKQAKRKSERSIKRIKRLETSFEQRLRRERHKLENRWVMCHDKLLTIILEEKS
jgi:uncharacterized protein YoxC